MTSRGRDNVWRQSFGTETPDYTCSWCESIHRAETRCADLSAFQAQVNQAYARLFPSNGRKYGRRYPRSEVR